MTNRSLPIVFTLLYIMAMLRPVMPVFEYMVNQDYIAEYLCVNKDKPMLNCNGKCYLAKMLQEEQDEKRQNLPSINLEEYPIGFVNILFCDFVEIISETNKLPEFIPSDPRQFAQSVFHPPNC
ncbi:hypothetical protein [Flagellimonas abyssi]|uniref:Uncharacterized protein n=1 Tax=Flagellimonas abyssi TaxID=2864871 RepID=A0ABS7ETS2_9FLAO|nr:hypothetical protein [Allomuricauda abyssi]MBW8201006.1 hypothetical protein [Allomuricauda abyssi]